MSPSEPIAAWSKMQIQTDYLTTNIVLQAANLKLSTIAPSFQAISFSVERFLSISFDYLNSIAYCLQSCCFCLRHSELFRWGRNNSSALRKISLLLLDRSRGRDIRLDALVVKMMTFQSIVSRNYTSRILGIWNFRCNQALYPQEGKTIQS